MSFEFDYSRRDSLKGDVWCSVVADSDNLVLFGKQRSEIQNNFEEKRNHRIHIVCFPTNWIRNISLELFCKFWKLTGHQMENK